MDELYASVAGRYAMKVVVSGQNTYVASASPEVTSASEKCWRVFRITDDGQGNVTKAFADGNPGFCHAANNMSSLTFANY